jgi:type II secretory ATPase GspE/PulE/Tfp pilus assembly ATPase PilB-like protein
MDNFKPDAAGARAVMALQPKDVYKLAGILGITPSRVAFFIAAFCKHKYFPLINPDDIKPGVLPAKFAMQNNIAAVAAGEATLIALGHPFNFELHEMIHNLLGADFEFCITEPSNISVLYSLAAEYGAEPQKIPGSGGTVVEESALNRLRTSAKSVKNEMNEPGIKYLTGKVLQFLAEEKGAEARIEAQGACYQVKAGAPGALRELARFNRTTGNMVVARLKALGGMDILERGKPQAGALGINRNSETYRLALATEGNAYGESLVLKPAV